MKNRIGSPSLKPDPKKNRERKALNENRSEMFAELFFLFYTFSTQIVRQHLRASIVSTKIRNKMDFSYWSVITISNAIFDYRRLERCPIF